MSSPAWVVRPQYRQRVRVGKVVIAFYQLGYGIAAFGAGPLQEAGIGLATIFGGTAVVAILTGGLAFTITPADLRSRCQRRERPHCSDAIAVR
ncbi:hypothetical protein KZZ52_37555 [Dactylosporangium sp. AC04546]|uniref:hypothetical protein n=1 Tax=Dactylosporangium sp. AC04546 TaxID=2862460 RepID=UPI001EE0EDAC|nr:hypothetical protein [Dactylosporangium sp. AC04546]WVK79672.1 hypothetical protein KZZ52_37555 [Dactylosporangium sp. AC04546]